jgi:hypothetical protein
LKGEVAEFGLDAHRGRYSKAGEQKESELSFLIKIDK